ncbi:putative glycolipid-binding domain-containing protein [Nocardia sp. NPDC004750]
MTTPASDPESPAASTQESRWPAILTWRAHDATRMESVRVQLNGNRIRATGRMIGGAGAEHPAFSASYDLVTDENGVTKRLSLRTTTAGGERHASIARDEENYWLVDAGGNHVRSTFAGALDVDVVLSPFFNTLPIRRYDLQHAVEDVQVPVVYVRLPDLLVQEATLIYSSAADGISVLSPVSSATVTVDADGFLLDYPGLAERI